MGSNFCWVFGSVLYMISGGVTENSKPSLLIFSRRSPIWRSPLPLTMTEVEVLFPGLTSKATSFSDSSISLFLISFNVILVPSFPAKGEVLTLIDTPIRGGSTLIEGITFYGKPYSTAVWVTLQLGNPAIETISPAKARSSYKNESPVIFVILVTLPVSICFASWS